MELKLVVVFANKEGLGRLGWTPEEYKPGIPMRRYVTGYFDTRVKVLEELDFDDKYAIYREAILAYAEAFIGQTVYLGQVELVCRPISQGDIRGVSVAILNHPRLFQFRAAVTEVDIQNDIVDVEVDKANQQIPSKPKVLETGVLPGVPEDSGADTGTTAFWPGIPTLDQLRQVFRRLTRANPQDATRLAYEFVRMAEGELPPEHRHTLGLREAARRISERGITIDHKWLRRLFDEGRLEIGVAGPTGEPLFSPAECDSFVRPPRLKPGPKVSESENPEAIS